MMYADTAAHMPLLPTVRAYLKKRLEEDEPFANPNALHILGQTIKKKMEEVRESLAATFGLMPSQIIFNSGSSEGMAHILQSVLWPTLSQHADFTKGPPLLILSDIEHAALYEGVMKWQGLGRLEVMFLSTNAQGVVDPSPLYHLSPETRRRVVLVAMMTMNNETGVMQPYEEVSKWCQEYQIPYFGDTTQHLGKWPFHFQQSGLDFAVCSGHKLGAMTGVGFLMVKNPHLLKPLISGGGQESQHRGGTQHYLGIETLGVAIQELPLLKKDFFQEVQKRRDEFESQLKKEFYSLKIYGEKSMRAPHFSLLSFEGIHSQSIQIELESRGIYITTSSACSDNQPETSRVLKSMGIQDSHGRSTIRLSPHPLEAKEGFHLLGRELPPIVRGLQRANCHYVA